MHACIGVQGFLFHVRRTGSPFCSQHTCASSACVEDITHAFMTCPTSAPAIDWLISAWEALTGLVAPRTADFILLGIPSAGWLGCGEDGWVLQQWTRLRVATLGAIWRVFFLENRITPEKGKETRKKLGRQLEEEPGKKLRREKGRKPRKVRRKAGNYGSGRTQEKETKTGSWGDESRKENPI